MSGTVFTNVPPQTAQYLNPYLSCLTPCLKKEIYNDENIDIVEFKRLNLLYSNNNRLIDYKYKSQTERIQAKKYLLKLKLDNM